MSSGTLFDDDLLVATTDSMPFILLYQRRRCILLLVKDALIHCGGMRTLTKGHHRSILVSQSVRLVKFRILLNLHELPSADYATLPLLRSVILRSISCILLVDSRIRDVGVLTFVHVVSVLLEITDEAIGGHVLVLPQSEDFRILRMLTQISPLMAYFRMALMVLDAVLVT